MAKKKTESNWTEFEFSSTGFRAPSYDKPTCKVSKSSLAFYQTDLEDGQEVKILVDNQNGQRRFAIVPHSGGPKKLKGNKNKTRVHFASRKLIQELGLVDSTDQVTHKELPGAKDKIGGKDVWMFSIPSNK